MRVHLCRHAKAEPGDPDELRELNSKGIEQAHALGIELSRATPTVEVVLTSPLVRARQTAELIAEKTGARLLVDARLAPGATSADLRAATIGLVGVGAVAVVGHQPDCSEIMLELTGVDPGFKVAGRAELEL